LAQKYGICEKVAIGKGATAVVKLAHKWDRSTEKLYAVKEFRKRRKNESEKEYVKKLTSEFCISSTLHHINVVETVDLVQNEEKHWCEVMEYCPGGDLYSAIKKGTMTTEDINIYFKQIVTGVAYLHSMGVAHRDIKPENLLLDNLGHIKITDFGVSDVFRMCWEKQTHMSKGLCGSEPYIAPEQFEQKGEAVHNSVSSCFVLIAVFCRIRRTLSRCLGMRSSLLLHASAGTAMASSQAVRSVVRFVPTQLPFFRRPTAAG
jgi:serine/threonine protein kinase